MTSPGSEFSTLTLGTKKNLTLDLKRSTKVDFARERSFVQVRTNFLFDLKQKPNK